MIIDAQTHLGFESYSRGQWTGRESLETADDYVESLRDAAVDRGFTFSTSAFRQHPRTSNDDLARARDRYTKVIIPYGTVDPYWDERKLRNEMRRCVKELGFVGFKFTPWVQGLSMMVSGMDVVAEECIDMDVPVTFHDGSPLYCTALQVAYYAWCLRQGAGALRSRRAA